MSKSKKINRMLVHPNQNMGELKVLEFVAGKEYQNPDLDLRAPFVF